MQHTQGCATGGAGKTTKPPIGQVSSFDRSVQCDPLSEHDLKCMRNRQACGPRMLASGPPVQSGVSGTSETSTVHAVWLDRRVCSQARETRRCRSSDTLAAPSSGRLCQARFRDMVQCRFGLKVTTRACASLLLCRRAAFGTLLAAGVLGKVCAWNCRRSYFRLALAATGASDLVCGLRSGASEWPTLSVPCDAQPLGGAVLALSTACAHRLATE